MSERGGYPPGVPCWVACVEPEPEMGVAFYTELFGWEAESLMAAHLPGTPPPTAVWSTFVCVESAEEAAANVSGAGGSLIGEPFDSPGGGRIAVLADPAGVVFCVWHPGWHRGAQVVNEPGAWSMSQLNTPVEPPHWSVDFWVRDADATAELADDLGGGVLVPPYDVPGFRETVLADPRGAVFKVSQLTAGSN